MTPRRKLALVLGPSLLAVALGAQGDRPPSIMAVMHKQYTASRAPFPRIKKELGSEAPDWPGVQEAARAFLALGEALEKNRPRRGDEASWRRFTGRHLDDVRALIDAADARDREAVRSAYRRLESSCQGCHDAHKFRRGG